MRLSCLKLSCIMKVLLVALSLSIQLLIAVDFSWVPSVAIDYSWVPSVAINYSWVPSVAIDYSWVPSVAINYSWVPSVAIDYSWVPSVTIDYSWVPFLSLSLSIFVYGYLLYNPQWKQPTKENKPPTELDSMARKSPMITSQPTNQNDVLPRKTVVFSVQATGTELTYQWQWKQFGKEGNKDGWQNLSGGSSKFQVRDVKANKAGYYRCMVSNSAGSDTSECASLTVAAELADLVNELQDVSDWLPFGLHLGIEMPRLQAIKVDCPTLGERRTQMLNEWQKKVTPTWSAVVQALDKIGMRRLASELAQKYGALEPPSKLPDCDPLDQLKCYQEEELHEQIQKLRGDLEQEHRKLVDADECLRQSQESKAKANEKMSKAMVELEESRKNVEKISQEKSDLENYLEIRELEHQVLSERIQTKDAYNQILQQKVDKKRKKIKSLKQEIQEKESELRVAIQEVISRQEELSEAQKELKKQHEEVIRLQREKEELACSYNIEKEQVSKIVQLLVSDKEEMQQQLTSMKEESELKSQQIEYCTANITHLSEEIKTLSSFLQEKEAAAAQLHGELDKCEQVASTQLLTFIRLRTQIAELERRLQETEEQKQQAELDRKAIVQEMKSKENLKAQFHAKLDGPPVIMNHPKNLRKVSLAKPVTFTVQSTGTDPLRYHWQWKPAKEEGEWQPCPTEWSDGATLTILKVEKFHEGSYRCVVSNYAGSLVSEPAQLTVAHPPRVGSHSQELEDVHSSEQVEMILQCKQFLFPDKLLHVESWPMFEAAGYSFLESSQEEDCVMLQCRQESQLCLVSYNCDSKQIKAYIKISMERIQKIVIGPWDKLLRSKRLHMRIFYTSVEDKMCYFTLGPRTMTLTSMDEDKDILMGIADALSFVQPSIKVVCPQKLNRKRSPSHSKVVVINRSEVDQSETTPPLQAEEESLP